MMITLLIVTLQIVLLLTATLLPLKGRRAAKKIIFFIDRDTSDAQLAVNKHGVLERITVADPQRNKNI
ncbi:hypothetical protein [Mucilaginibacter antarcticus]|uniref:Uncharacterized protein n=1 Tax=Mucilaginibacter antarcticus TaxID=1855725 RepID=A0ABW5XT20_9SPHI